MEAIAAAYNELPIRAGHRTRTRVAAATMAASIATGNIVPLLTASGIGLLASALPHVVGQIRIRPWLRYSHGRIGIFEVVRWRTVAVARSMTPHYG